MRTLRKLPGYYFKPETLTKALLNIRNCLASGLTIQGMLQELSRKYFASPYPPVPTRVAMAKLLTSFHEFRDPISVDFNTNLYKVPPKEGLLNDRSYTYQMLKECFLEQGRVTWLDEVYNDNTYKRICHTFKDPRYWMVVPHNEKENVITICQCARVYCVIDPNLTLHLIVMESASDTYITYERDNECGAPRYTKANTGENDFISPVYRVRIAKRILNYCLQRVGYPYVDIKMKVVYTSPSLELIHPENCENVDEIKEVEVIEAKNLKKDQGFLLRCPYNNLFTIARDPVDREMLRMLSAAIGAASLLYLQFYLNDKLDKTTLKDMEEESDMMGLFVSSWNMR